MQKPFSILKHSIPVFVLSCCLLLSQSAARGESLGTITVDAGNYTRLDTPVSLDAASECAGSVRGRQSAEIVVGALGHDPCGNQTNL